MTTKKTAKKKTVVEEPVVIPTIKTYTSAVMVNDPLPQANDIFVERQVGTVNYNEATNEVTTYCMIPRYEAMFNRFSRMTYYIETNDAPIPITKSNGEQWMKNLYNALSLKVNEERNISFWVTEPIIATEEPVIS